MRKAILRRLRPTADSVRDLALRETDPSYYDEFQPITLGPLGNALVLAFVAVAAAVTVPIRLITGAFWKR